jgi:hypothetical protein
MYSNINKRAVVKFPQAAELEASTTTRPRITQQPGFYELTFKVTDNGLPALQAQQTVPVLIGLPLAVQSITENNREITLTWNSFPGRQYIVHSANNVSTPNWDYHATVTANSELTTYTTVPVGDDSSIVYMISTASSTCSCVSLTLRHVKPNRTAKVDETYKKDYDPAQ